MAPARTQMARGPLATCAPAAAALLPLLLLAALPLADAVRAAGAREAASGC
jgi:hypothetical protein